MEGKNYSSVLNEAINARIAEYEPGLSSYHTYQRYIAVRGVLHLRLAAKGLKLPKGNTKIGVELFNEALDALNEILPV